MVVLCGLIASVLLLPTPDARARNVIVVSPGGSLTAAGTTADPHGSISRALEMAEPGDTVLLHGGTYDEDVVVTVNAEATDPGVTVAAWGDGTPVLRGRLWLRRPSNWDIRDLEVTWRDDLDGDMHLVKMTGGVGWTLQGMTVHGARSFAAVLVAGLDSHPNEPADWLITDSCIRDTADTNGTNQDQLIYVNTGMASLGGAISGNTLTGAPNGSAIKLGGSRSGSGGAANVVVADNTISATAQGVLVAWGSHDNLIHGNRFGPIQPPYAAIRSYDLDNDTNVARDNQVYGAARFMHYHSPEGRVQDGGGNRQLAPAEWDEPDGCIADAASPPVRAYYGRGR